jgi:hypothetical protein
MIITVAGTLCHSITTRLPAEGWSRDVSEDVAGEIIDRAYDADETLTESTKRFIDRHIDIERRPRASSHEKKPPFPQGLRHGRGTWGEGALGPKSPGPIQTTQIMRR